ncbi:MAG: hypothetical protein QXP36_10250 [Conexivisphaerales archaeon]
MTKLNDNLLDCFFEKAGNIAKAPDYGVGRYGQITYQDCLARVQKLNF